MRRRAMKVLQWLVQGAGAPALHRHQLGLPGVLASDARVLRATATRWSTWTRSRRWCRRATRASAWRRCAVEHARPHRRRAGDPRLKLVYYYVRLLVVLAGVDDQPRPARPPHGGATTTDEREAMSTEAHVLDHRAGGGGDRVHRAPRAQPPAAREVLGALVLDRPRPARCSPSSPTCSWSSPTFRHRLPAGHVHAAGVELPARAGAALLVGAVAPRGPHAALAEEHALLREEFEERLGPRREHELRLTRARAVTMSPSAAYGRPSRASRRSSPSTTRAPLVSTRLRISVPLLFTAAGNRVLDRLPAVAREHRVERRARVQHDVVGMVHLEVAERARPCSRDRWRSAW